MKAGRNARIDILQIIRLFAASMIILYHTKLIGGRGYFGVHIFFIISGFLAVLSTRSRVPAGRYLLNRCIRLIPLYWIFTLVTFLVLTIRPGISNMSDEDPMHFLFSLLFIPFKGKAGAVLPILAVGWTMQLEMAFTLLFALSLLISHRHRVWVCTLFLLALTAVGLFLKPRALFPKFYTQIHLVDFCLGFAIAWCYLKLRRNLPEDRPALSRLPESFRFPVRTFLALVSLASLIFLVLDLKIPGSRYHAVHLEIASFFLVVSLLLNLDRVSFPPKLLALCEMTYSIYLVEYFTTSVYKRLLPDPPGLPMAILSLVILYAVTFALSVIPWFLIEVRLTSRLKRILLPSRVPERSADPL